MPFEAQQRAAKALLTSVLRPGVDSGLLETFETTAKTLDTGLTDNFVKFTTILDRSAPGGGSAVNDAVVVAAKALAGWADSKRPRVLFLFSDGNDNQSRFTLDETIAVLQRTGIHVYAFCVTSSSDCGRGTSNLNHLASETGGRAFLLGTGKKDKVA